MRATGLRRFGEGPLRISAKAALLLGIPAKAVEFDIPVKAQIQEVTVLWSRWAPALG